MKAQAGGRAAYDRVLESFSQPLMQRYEGQYRFATLQTYPDGVTSDFHFAAEQAFLHAWRYPDRTRHVHNFSDLLRDNDAARRATKQWVEISDPDADRFIASLRGTGWAVTGKLRRDQPDIFAPEGAVAPHAGRDCEGCERGDDMAWDACFIVFYGDSRKLLKKNGAF